MSTNSQPQVSTIAIACALVDAHLEASYHALAKRRDLIPNAHWDAINPAGRQMWKVVDDLRQEDLLRAAREDDRFQAVKDRLTKLKCSRSKVKSS